MKKIVILIECLTLAFISCNNNEYLKNEELSTKDSIAAATRQADSLAAIEEDMIASASLDNNNNSEPTEETKTIGETRLRYKNFSLVFYNFEGYERDKDRNGDVYKQTYSLQFGGNNENIIEAEFNDNEQNDEVSGDLNPNYEETLIVKKDTLHLSEQLFDDRINNTLIEIIPNNKEDKFKMSFCYLSSLNEIFDNRNHKSKELDKLYENQLTYKEQTKFVNINDSANFYFRALPHTADMEEITVLNNKIVPVKPRNTKAQISWEQSFYEEEIKRIKKKYNLKDTLVIIPGEYDTVATLTKNKKLFGYGYLSFLFRVERYNNNKLVETKYIVIEIASGC